MVFGLDADSTLFESAARLFYPYFGVARRAVLFLMPGATTRFFRGDFFLSIFKQMRIFFEPVFFAVLLQFLSDFLQEERTDAFL